MSIIKLSFKNCWNAKISKCNAQNHQIKSSQSLAGKKLIKQAEVSSCNFSLSSDLAPYMQ